jgi:hypothetical protein
MMKKKCCFSIQTGIFTNPIHKINNLILREQISKEIPFLITFILLIIIIIVVDSFTTNSSSSSSSNNKHNSNNLALTAVVQIA